MEGRKTVAEVLMIQGTMSGAGKSLITAGLARVFARRGLVVAPFKSQNMSLNSFITDEGLEMGRAQVMQAEAAGVAPRAAMNPILLKPSGDTCSQVIVNGRVRTVMGAKAYYGYRKNLIPDVLQAFRTLERDADLILIEGAGSPAEINLRKDDIVNMGLAKMVGANVLLVGDIDRGGVFAQLYGTKALLMPDEQELLKGMIINKFRGDQSILDPGIRELEERTACPVLGVVPYMHLSLDDEDSLSERLQRCAAPGKAECRRNAPGGRKAAGEAHYPDTDIAVIRFPRLSNFTDFDVFDEFPDVSVRYVSNVRQLGCPDLIVLPGSKNTPADLAWMRQEGLADAVCRLAGEGAPVLGICGGFQMLGEWIADPERVEVLHGTPDTVRGLGLLPCRTVLKGTKTTRQVRGVIPETEGAMAMLSGKPFEGYEIHMGETVGPDGAPATFFSAGNVLGTYVHGLFDKKEPAAALVSLLRAVAGKPGAAGAAPVRVQDLRQFRQSQYDRLADTLEQCLDIRAIEALFKKASV